MKFRCVTNSLRFRLRKSDVDILKRQGGIRGNVAFPNQQCFSYGIDLVEAGVNATFEQGNIVIRLPKNFALEWMESDQVSWSFYLPTNDENKLSVLIEKDFPCKHTGTDFEDTFYELQPQELKMFRKK